MPASFGMKDMMVWAIERSDTPFGDDVFAAAMTRAASHGHSNIVEYIMSLPSVDLSPHHAYANALTSAVRASQAGVVETLMGVPDLVDAFAEADEFFRRKVLGIAVIGMSLKRERCTLDALLKSRMFATTDVEYILKAFCHGKAVECTLLNYLRV
ncbi:hypothetical protein BC829DRAFT_430965 [Chytridium lagenaria]|nr:hypothetical protein BC829DRAFT_430965 [Chytridium lagenaria]